MSLIRWDPTVEIAGLDRTLRRFFDGVDGAAPWEFPVDLYETPEALLVRADLPGVRPEDVQVQIQDGRLSIRARRRAEAPEGASAVALESAAGEFARSFALRVPVVPEDATATCEAGVLTVRLPKAAQARARTVPVKAA